MILQKKIQAKKEEFKSSAPKEIQETMARAVKLLRESGIEEKALKPGDKAPDFTLDNVEGKPVNLKEVLSAGPVVLGFYRGRW